MLHPNFVIVGAIIASLGALSYLIDTIKGNKVRPNRVSYSLWAIAPLIAFAAEISQGVGIQSLLTFTVGFWPLAILGASFLNKKSEWKVSNFDLTCGSLSLMGLFLWYLTKVGNIAIFFGIVADGLAALPTVVKSYRYPETETAWPYFSSAVFAVITLLTIKNWDFAHYGFPIYILLANIVISSTVHFKLGKRKSWQTVFGS